MPNRPKPTPKSPRASGVYADDIPKKIVPRPFPESNPRDYLTNHVHARLMRRDIGRFYANTAVLMWSPATVVPGRLVSDPERERILIWQRESDGYYTVDADSFYRWTRPIDDEKAQAAFRAWRSLINPDTNMPTQEVSAYPRARLIKNLGHPLRRTAPVRKNIDASTPKPPIGTKRPRGRPRRPERETLALHIPAMLQAWRYLSPEERISASVKALKPFGILAAPEHVDRMLGCILDWATKKEPSHVA